MIGPSVLARVAAGEVRAGHHLTVHQNGGPVTLGLDELDRRARQLGWCLLRRGLRTGDRVGIMAPNRLEWVLTDLACVKTKLVSAGLDAGMTGGPAELADRYDLKLVVSAKPADDPRVLPVDDLLPALAGAPTDPALPPVTHAPGDAVTIKFTSGSTGRPKGLAATAGSIDSSINAVQSQFHHGPDDKLFVFLPLSLLQQRYWIYSALVFGHDIVVTTYERAFHAVRREEPTVVMGVPGFFDALRREIDGRARGQRDRARVARQLLGGRIRYLWTGSAPASEELLRFYDDCGLAIYEGYGLNETCIATKNTPTAHRRGSVGRALPGKHVRVDQDGVVIVTSAHPVNTHYLYSEPGASEEVFLPDGSVRTGDLGRIDEDGYLYILGRADDVVVLRNGRNVLVREIEERLRAGDVIHDCVLLGFGQDWLVAVVCAAEGAEAEIRARVEAHIDHVNGQGDADERIGGYVLADEPFSIENGLLTSQFKPRRREILARYQDAVRRSYGGAG